MIKMYTNTNQWLTTFLNWKNFSEGKDFPEPLICQKSYYDIKDVFKSIYNLFITVAYTFGNIQQYLLNL